MRGRSEQSVARVGAISILVLLLAMAAALNLQKFPGFRGVAYKAEFSDASGLRKGNMVQVAGIRVGRVSNLDLEGNKVTVTFTVKPHVKFGTESEASVEVLNLLGEKFLNLTPKGTGEYQAGETIPLDRTRASYDIVRVFGELSDTTEEIKIPRLQRALTTLGNTLGRSSQEARGALRGLSRISLTVAQRDDELQLLLQRANAVAGLLAERKGDVMTLIKQGDLLLGELRNRRDAIHDLLTGTAALSKQLGGLVDDNQRQLRPALQELSEVQAILVRRKEAVRQTLNNLGPYVDILSNIIGTGPWFDAYASNLFGIGTGEFVLGQEP